MAKQRQMNLYLLGETLEPQWSKPATADLNPQNSSFWYSITPTHTYTNAPDDIEVLLVPGGPGARYLNITTQLEFIKTTYPKIKYLISICTGAGVVARTGVLDGRNATTNKRAWARTTAMGPKVLWRSPARWVVDGNIWTSSGVSAGHDQFGHSYCNMLKQS